MTHVFVIIDKYIYDITNYNNSNNIFNFDIKDYHLKNGTSDIIMKHDNDDSFKLFKNVNKYKNYKNIYLICENVFRKNIPKYFMYFFSNHEENNFLDNMLNKEYILVYNKPKKFLFYIKINNNLISINIIYLAENWCYFSKKGIYNSLYIEDLINLLIEDNFKKIL